MVITTFTPYYCMNEDRVRLVINYTDFVNRIDFWITRAFFLKLIPSMEEYLYTYASAGLMNTIDHQEDTNTLTQTDSGTLAVTDKKGLLLEGVDMTYYASIGTYEIRGKIGVRHSFMQKLNLSFIHLISPLQSLFYLYPYQTITLYFLIVCGLLAEDLVDEGCFGEIPDNLIHYIDYSKIGRDLSFDYTEFEDGLLGRAS